jgi:molecular chaperone GrpE
VYDEWQMADSMYRLAHSHKPFVMLYQAYAISHKPFREEGMQQEKVIDTQPTEQTPEATQPTEASAAQPAAIERDELTEAKALAADYLDKWRRTTAEFSNYRKRQEREYKEMAQSAGADLIKQLLPVLDDFDRAFKAVPTDMQNQSVFEGFRLIERKFNQMLERAGVTTIVTIGQPFDPNVHESVASAMSDQDEGIVLEEFRKGYKLYDKVLRPAMVKISAGKLPTQPEPPSTNGEAASDIPSA